MINACLKLGGDPTLGHEISIHNFIVPYDVVETLRHNLFPKLKLLVLEIPLSTLPDIRCCACDDFHTLPVRQGIVKTLALTHIHSSLELWGGPIFLFHRECAEKILKFFEGRYVRKNYCISTIAKVERR